MNCKLSSLTELYAYTVQGNNLLYNLSVCFYMNFYVYLHLLNFQVFTFRYFRKIYSLIVVQSWCYIFALSFYPLGSYGIPKEVYAHALVLMQD